MGNDTLTFSIDKDLKIELKVIAIRRETTLTKLLNEILEDLWLKTLWFYALLEYKIIFLFYVKFYSKMECSYII